ncbi:MAG: flagellar hook-associated protein FlgL [Pirellulales bacterium]
MAISPVPTTRVSDLLTRQRLLAQAQIDQQELFRLQSQISTGQRISLPSEDAPAAGRAIELQRLIERKDQAISNLTTNNSYLGATDLALANVSNLLTSIRGTALGSIGVTADDSQRAAAAIEVQRALQQLIDVGNQKFRGRYLFAGTELTKAPFVLESNKYVSYGGNEGALSSYADIDLLFESNVNGDRVFGAFSPEVRGSADLNPILTSKTRMSDLNAGEGVRLGSIAITDGTYTSVVDLSKASTIGDVVAAIEARPPGYDATPPSTRTLRVDLTATGLVVSLDSAGGGDLRIREIGNGFTARDLGIFDNENTGTGPIGGTDLDPRLRLTTQLANLLGVRASTVVTSAGQNNDVIVEAKLRGPDQNGLTVQFVDDDLVRAGPGLVAGSETVVYSDTAIAARASVEFSSTANNDILLTATTAGTSLNDTTIALAVRAPDAGGVLVSYNAVAKTYTISVEGGVSTADDIVNAINADAGSGGVFSAALDTSLDATNDGSYVFQPGDVNPLAGSTGQSGGAANTLFVFVQRDATTANQVVAAINNDPTASALVTARVDPKDTRELAEQGTGRVATSASGITANGAGIEFDQDSGLQITNGGQTHIIDLSSADTIEDLLNLLNGSDAGVVAQLNASRTGIDVRSRVSGGDFAIGENGGTTATELGLRSYTEATRLDDFNHGRGVNRSAPTPFVGGDVRIHRSDGVTFDVDLSGARDVGEVLDAINNHADNTGAGRVVARLAEFGNGIELVEDSASTTATLEVERLNHSFIGWDLGLIPEGSDISTLSTAATTASATVALVTGQNDVQLIAAAGGSLADGVTVRLVSAAANNATFDATNKVLTVEVAAGANVSDVFGAINGEGTFAASLASGATTALGDAVTTTGDIGVTSGGTSAVIATGDRNPREVVGVFNVLVRLADALRSNDEREIERILAQLDTASENVTLSRADIGARQQSLDALNQRIDTEVVDLKSVLSNEIEVDLTEAISNLAGKQASYQASLQMTAQIVRLTLLDYL